MHLFTSSWAEYKGAGRLAICQGRPRGQPAGYRFYKPLAPTWDIIKNTNSIAEYRPRYHAEILDPLDPNQVLADLIKLAADHPPVLMCFEVTPLHDNNFCHRTMAADWLAKHTGITHSEMADHVQQRMAV